MRKAALGLMVVAAAGCSGSGSSHLAGDGSVDSAADDAATIDAPPVDGAMPDGGGGNPTGIGGPPVGACKDTWCWVLPRPQGDVYASVWASSLSDVWTVTESGSLFHYDGASWSLYGTYGQFGRAVTGDAMWGRASNDVWMAHGSLSHWDGTTWTSYPTAGNGVIAGVGPTNVWTNGGASEWDGTQWLSHPAPTGTTIGLGGVPGTVLAVSTTGTISQWTGAGWGILDASSHPGVAAEVLDATHIVVLQDNDVAFWDTGTWTQHTPPVTATWFNLVARSASDVWIAGYGPGATKLRYHWNGTAWSPAPDPGAMLAAADLWAVGTDLLAADVNQIRRWNGTSWSVLTEGPQLVHSAWGTSPTDVWALTSTESTSRTQHWNGTAWMDVAFPAQTGDYMDRASIWGSAPNDYWIAAGHSESFSSVSRLLFHWDGSTWTRSAAGSLGVEDGVVSSGFTKIWGTGTDDIYASSAFAVFHKDGTGWHEVTQLGTSMSVMTTIFGSGPNDVYVVRGTTLWRWNGTAWSSKATPAQVFGGWANSPTDVWLGGGSLYHYNGTLFVPVPTTAPSNPVGIGGTMYTFGDHTMVTWNGGVTGTQTSSAKFFDGPITWPSPDGHLWSTTRADGYGLLVH